MNPRDLASEIKGAGYNAFNIVAGGAGDNAEVVGETIDRSDCLSAVVEIPFKATLAAAATLKMGVTLQQSDDDGSTWGVASTLKAATDVVATGPGGGGTVKGIVELPLNLDPKSKTIRVNVTPDLSAANTDVASFGVVVVLGGAVKRPV